MINNTKKPLIVVVNDDSVYSKGIKVLANLMSEIGEVVVLAPDAPQSGMGHAITLGTPLRVAELELFGDKIKAYKCSGTPADCVKFAKHYVLKGRTIDLVVSGINHGSNSSISVVYSGTMSAALEAAIEGIPAIGFSLGDYSPEADFSHIPTFVKEIVQKVLVNKLPIGIALNVNFPAKRDTPIRGIKIARQALAVYQEKFEERKDPYGKTYYWMDGFLKNEDTQGGTDEDYLVENYVTIVPTKFDLTSYSAMSILEQWGF